MDIYSTHKRSQIMSKISGKKTKPEIIIGRILSKSKYRYRQNDKTLPGTPDITFPRGKKAIFVNGCFWHGHKGCKRSKLPATNQRFWKDKIEGNVKHDRKVRRELNKQGWRTLTIWQCQISKSNQMFLRKRIRRFIIHRH